MFQKLQDLLQTAKRVVVIIANNPDADSLGSALALEEILGNLNKEVGLYCRPEIPYYIRFLDGWSRVVNQLPSNYDLAIMVDNSNSALLEDQNQNSIVQSLKLRPLVILDHHPTQSDLDFAIIYNQPQMAATGQLIYQIAKELDWPLNTTSANCLAASILGDTLGFASQNMLNNPQPLRVMADLVDLGVDLAKLHQARLKWQQIPVKLVTYKGELLQRIQFDEDQQIASLTISHAEIKKIGSLFNPTTVLDEMRLVEGVKISLGFKEYENNLGEVVKITLRIRCYQDCKIANLLAETYGGGGHVYAAGVKWEGQNLNLSKLEKEVIETANLLLKENQKEDETQR